MSVRAMLAGSPWQLLDSPIIEGDCLDVLRQLPDCSVDAVVTDPPYGIGFMGHEWDQPGEHGPVRANGRPEPFAGGGPQLGPHVAGPAAAVTRSPQKRAVHPAPSGFTAKRGGVPGNGGAMEAGRYDLSSTANRRFQVWCEEWGREALRVLKPGGHAVVFGGTRMFHRLTCGLEDAGFEIRDTLAWMFGSGFPKSLDVSKAIDRAAGAERPVVGTTRKSIASMGPGEGPFSDDSYEWKAEFDRTGPATPAAEQWEGWGTALKPGYEPIVLARKPLAGTVAANVLEHGTGALNIDGCRIATPGGSPSIERREQARRAGRAPSRPGEQGPTITNRISPERYMEDRPGEAAGRWPATVILDEEAAALLDEQTGELRSGFMAAGTQREGLGYRGGLGTQVRNDTHGDSGGASRFFYCAKTARSEREAGLEHLEARPSAKLEGGALRSMVGHERDTGTASSSHDRRSRNVHPTVKPIALMAWLLRLVTPSGGVVLDPFAGSGSTVCAGATEGIAVIGIERKPEYVQIARARAAWWAAHPEGVELADRIAAERRRRDVVAGGQVDLFSEEIA